MDVNTPGFQLINTPKGSDVRLTEFSELKKVNCNVDRFYFPSHSIREDLLKIVENVNPEKVVLVHGEENSISWLGQKILGLYPDMKVISPENGKSTLL